jgi:serine O-acetyltransferase
VVKEVPPGATAIGIPARIIEAEAAAPNGRFAAYAVGKDLNDPMAKAVHELIGHCADTEKRIEQILAELKRLGGRIEEREAHPLDANSLNKMVD